MSPDPQTVREIAQDCAADYFGDACDIAAHVIGHFGPGVPNDLYPWITAVRADLAAAVATWPAEQQPAGVVTAEQQQDGAVGGEAAGRLAAFCDAWGAWGNAEVIECTLLGGIDRPLALTDLDAVLAERTALTTRVAELESEREADVRAVAAWLDTSTGNQIKKFKALEARFADRIDAFIESEAKGGE